MNYLKSYQNTTPECCGDTISTGQDGLPIDFVNLNDGELKAYFTLERIAYALAGNNRYAGESQMSVAQHCVRMADAAMLAGEPAVAFECLMHETAEVIMGDLKRPVKKLVGSLYKPVEEKLEKRLCSILGCRYPFSDMLHIIDANVCQEELYMMKMHKLNPYPNYWSREFAMQMWIHTYHKVVDHITEYKDKEIIK